MGAMPPRRTLMVEVAYAGEPFHGVALQPGLPTVGSCLQDLVSDRLQTPLHGLAFAARTDAGVRAHQNFATGWIRSAEDRTDALNSLPGLEVQGLGIRRAAWVDRSVHARSAALFKHYRYQVSEAAEAAHAWALGLHLDLPRMQQAAALLVGTHDFEAFRSARCSAKHTIKTLLRVELTRRDSYLVLDIWGDGFLRRMMRLMAGALVEVGRGERTLESFRELLGPSSPERVLCAAPAAGLELVSVSLRPPLNEAFPPHDLANCGCAYW